MSSLALTAQAVIIGEFAVPRPLTVGSALYCMDGGSVAPKPLLQSIATETVNKFSGAVGPVSTPQGSRQVGDKDVSMHGQLVVPRFEFVPSMVSICGGMKQWHNLFGIESLSAFSTYFLDSRCGTTYLG